MKRAPKPPISELYVSDGQRHLGRLVAKGDGFECFDADGGYLGRVASVPEARATIIRSGRARIST